jgi:peptidoglycan/xylan/chitin deacetylase (PgdA/CDA1 family)
MNRHVLTVSLLAAVVVATSVASASCACGRPSAQPPVSPSVTVTVGGSISPSASPSATASVTAVPTPSRSPTPSVSHSRTPSPTATPPSGPPTVPAGLRGLDVEVIPTSRRIVALTFDGGANADGLASILATLDREDVRATFFLTGEFATNYPTSVKAIVARGHRLGNHTATHPHLPALPSDAAIVNQLKVAESQIRAAGGTDPRPLFRFPFGDRNSHTIAVVNGAGYVAVRWTVDSLGWKGTTKGGITAQMVIERVVAAARPGEIVLMHVGSNPDDHTTLDAQALPTVIARLRSLGYGFVTLDALVAAR